MEMEKSWLAMTSRLVWSGERAKNAHESIARHPPVYAPSRYEMDSWWTSGGHFVNGIDTVSQYHSTVYTVLARAMSQVAWLHQWDTSIEYSVCRVVMQHQ